MTAPELPQALAAYIIDVCRHCGAHAVWPFPCGHRAPGWTIPITVYPSARTRTDVQDAIIAAHAEQVTA